jgi:signal transduction histidine kinase
MKSDFVNNMTHEFKTPLASISLAAQMLHDGGVSKTPETLKHISGVIYDESRRLRFQVEKVLQMAMFDKDKANLKLELIDINEIIDNVCINFGIRIDTKQGELITEFKATESWVMADEVHITNAIYNLLDNALKYSPEKPRIVVKTWNEKNKLIFSVKDYGIGIKKEEIKRIFEKFYRVSTGNLHNVKGFGLGLAYVKKVIENHKGQIKVESQLDLSTEFIICLPIKTPKNGN